ncbi:autotransporter outer membrane beta-barrel domain-containing protein [Bartonella sp. A05]|uniref:autotransporter outer membrane beta-barrel domain-containing protein n=1 Tax=Bartonella sp. A05 TaxID=2967261 RepID=UPI002E778F5B|nr:autotransporter outer membrane beta-barrel domain-containing protein [Bartonella sp. A05]
MFFSCLNLAYAQKGSIAQPNITVKDSNPVTMHNVNIRGKMSAVSAEGQNSMITIEGGSIVAKLLALNAERGGHINAKGIIATTTSTGLQTANGTINLKDSTIIMKGDYYTRGIILQNLNRSIAAPSHQAESDANVVTLTNTKILVEEGIGIYGPLGKDTINLVNSEIRSDLLLTRATDFIIPGVTMSKGTLTLTADNSLLEGGARIVQDNETILNLNNDTKWFLKISKNELDSDLIKSLDYMPIDIKKRAHSEVSVLNIHNSSIIFDEPTQNHYQTLRVKSRQSQKTETMNTATVYTATGNAKLYVNSEWSTGIPISEQKTDRLIVDGDVSGITTVYIKTPNTNKESKKIAANLTKSDATVPVNERGISIIQVAGQADKNSFKLENGYMTMEGLPYKYTLNAYAPGKTSTDQSLFNNGRNSSNGNNFWDFRLQQAYLDPDAKVKAIVPQMANYLVMPNALFSAGISDVSNQIALLANIRLAPLDISDDNNKGIFASSYGDRLTLSSKRGALQYGYDTDVRYVAAQAGAVISTLENQDITTHFGILGSYGQLSFTPKDMESAYKSTLDKWLFTASGGINHHNGLYADTLLSYGFLNGNIASTLSGNTAKFENAKTVNASITVGHKLITSIKGLVFEPQAQVIYQRLMFDTISDASDFEIDMNNPRQWLVRLGGRLTQTIIQGAEDNTVSIYGKCNVTKTFSNSGTIQAGDIFHLEPMGSSIEGGLGINAHISQKTLLNGNVSYQHNLQKAGISGINVSSGVRYRF